MRKLDLATIIAFTAALALVAPIGQAIAGTSSVQEPPTQNDNPVDVTQTVDIDGDRENEVVAWSSRIPPGEMRTIDIDGDGDQDVIILGPPE